jgi:hypothetical protein
MGFNSAFKGLNKTLRQECSGFDVLLLLLLTDNNKFYVIVLCTKHEERKKSTQNNLGPRGIPNLGIKRCILKTAHEGTRHIPKHIPCLLCFRIVSFPLSPLTFPYSYEQLI